MTKLQHLVHATEAKVDDMIKVMAKSHEEMNGLIAACWKPSSLLSNVHFRNTTKNCSTSSFALNFVYLYF